MKLVQVRSSPGRSGSRSRAINLDRIAFIEFLSSGRSHVHFDESFSLSFDAEETTMLTTALKIARPDPTRP